MLTFHISVTLEGGWVIFASVQVQAKLGRAVLLKHSTSTYNVTMTGIIWSWTVKQCSSKNHTSAVTYQLLRLWYTMFLWFSTSSQLVYRCLGTSCHCWYSSSASITTAYKDTKKVKLSLSMPQRHTQGVETSSTLSYLGTTLDVSGQHHALEKIPVHTHKEAGPQSRFICLEKRKMSSACQDSNLTSSIP